MQYPYKPFILLVLLWLFSIGVFPKTITVKPDESIQSAIDSATSGDVIEVLKGSYVGPIRVWGKSLAIIGKDLPNISFHDFSHDNGAIVDLLGASITLQGFVLRGGLTTKCKVETAGIAVHPGSGTVRILNNEISAVGHDYSKCDQGGQSYGIRVYANSEGSLPINDVEISGNKIHSLQLGQSEAISINGNILKYAVVNNEVYDVDNIAIDIIGHEKCRPFSPAAGLVEGNTVYDLNDGNPGQNGVYPFIAGIYIDGPSGPSASNPLKVSGNVVTRFGVGIAVGSECEKNKVANISVLDNIVYVNLVHGIAIGKDVEAQGSLVENVAVTNNTSYCNGISFWGGSGPGEIHFGGIQKGALKKVQVGQNIVFATSAQPLVKLEGKPEGIKSADVSFTNNLFFSAKESIFRWHKNGVQASLDFSIFNNLFGASNMNIRPPFISENSANRDFLRIPAGSSMSGLGTRIFRESYPSN